jgi:hypothetical protein
MRKRKLRLDIDRLAVTSFAPAAIATRGEVTDDSYSCGCDTIEYACYELTLLAEDCFGPSAGCTIGTEA